MCLIFKLRTIFWQYMTHFTLVWEKRLSRGIPNFVLSESFFGPIWEFVCQYPAKMVQNTYKAKISCMWLICGFKSDFRFMSRFICLMKISPFRQRAHFWDSHFFLQDGCLAISTKTIQNIRIEQNSQMWLILKIVTVFELIWSISYSFEEKYLWHVIPSFFLREPLFGRNKFFLLISVNTFQNTWKA